MRNYISKISYKNFTFFRISNDVNGNPRYVFRFSDLNENYDEAVKLSRCIGGKKYRGKWFGGGIVVQSYSIEDDIDFLLGKIDK